MVRRHAVAALFLLLAGLPILGASNGTNPVTGRDERVTEVATHAGTEVQWRERINGVWQTPVGLTVNTVDDNNPQICWSTTTGRRFVVFWRDTSPPAVYLVRDDAAGGWGDPEVLSDTDEDSRAPECLFFGGEAHFAFTVRSGDYRSVVVAIAADEPPDCPGTGCPQDPPCPGPDCWINLIVLRTTNLTFSPSPQLHDDNDHLWVDWVDSQNEMGYAEYDSTTDTWSTLKWMSIVTSVPATRLVIAAEVQGN